MSAKRPVKYKLCELCGQPMKPKGVKKKPNEFDHASGCPNGGRAVRETKGRK
jgi:hypothetical protein